MTVWRVIRKGSGIRSHHYFLLLKITGPNLFGPYFSVIFGLTGPICARALKSLHLLELGPRGHHDWPVMPTIRELIAGQARCLCHEVIPFRDARRPRSRNSVVFDGGFVIAYLLK